MPELLRWNGYKFFFYSKEGMPLEPPHIHVAKAGCEAKLWLVPKVRVASSRRMDPHTLLMLTSIVEAHRDEFEERWNVHFA